ncbi:DedA family protein [Ferrigenium sp. UT5]|uniref:DedA family protein n=1 Tax=Ferrigenium sp. UT5 TaxID=3242105 RepID=UPI003553EB3E
MKELVNQLFGLFSQYGYAAVFVGVMLDNAGIPMAGELTLLLSGSLVASGSFHLPPIIMTGALAALVSDLLWYSIGRLGAAHLIRLYCRVSFGSGACHAHTEQMMQKFGPKNLIFARFIPGFRTFAAPMAGISRLPLGQFILFDSIGAVLWATVVSSGGWLLADQINGVVGQLEGVRDGVLLVAGLMLLVFIVLKLWIRKRHGRADANAIIAANGNT